VSESSTSDGEPVGKDEEEAAVAFEVENPMAKAKLLATLGVRQNKYILL